MVVSHKGGPGALTAPPSQECSNKSHLHTLTPKPWDLVSCRGATQGRDALGCVPRLGDRDRIQLLH